MVELTEVMLLASTELSGLAFARNEKGELSVVKNLLLNESAFTRVG